MSIPEYMRRRNSTMFVSSPPFGYDDTDNCTNAGQSWHPPQTPPRGMVYHENSCMSHTPTHSQSNSTAGPSQVKPTDVVPALFSFPSLSSRHLEELPDVSQLSIRGTPTSRPKSQTTMKPILEGQSSNMNSRIRKQADM